MKTTLKRLALLVIGVLAYKFFRFCLKPDIKLEMNTKGKR